MRAERGLDGWSSSESDGNGLILSENGDGGLRDRKMSRFCLILEKVVSSPFSDGNGVGFV